MGGECTESPKNGTNQNAFDQGCVKWNPLLRYNKKGLPKTTTPI